MTIEQRLRDARMEQGLSQEALAELVNVSRQTVSKWENGAAYPSGENLAALSKVFHLPVEALIYDDWTPPEEPEPVVVEVPVPVPAPKNYRLWALLAAALIAAGVLVGVMFFREPPADSVSQSTLEGEVIDIPITGDLNLLPPNDSAEKEVIS